MGNGISLLRVEKIVKQFPGTLALNELDFDARRGEVHAVVGENGAGKSTLMKILSGAYQKTSGKLILEGKEIAINHVEDARKHGITMIYQELVNFPKLTVAENIFMGRLPTKFRSPFIDKKALMLKAHENLRRFGLDIDPGSKLENITVAEKQFVEIIRAVITKDAKIIIMDEPTSSLSKSEIERLFLMIEELKKKGITILYVSHRLDEIVRISDRVSVFRDGKNRGTLEKEELDESKIIQLMLGHVLEKSKKVSVPRKEIVLDVRNLCIHNKVMDFAGLLYRGEILGIAGFVGSGKEELVKSLFGLWPAESKEILFKGKPVTINSPQDALGLGIVYLPEERKLSSLFLNMSVQKNIVSLWLFFSRIGMTTSQRREKGIAERYIEQFSIKTPRLQEEIINLSGGNQQKAVFSRLLAIQPEIMILHDPTRGIDIGSKEEIYRYIKTLAANGTSIIFVSSEIDEISYLCQRVIVLSRGRKCGEFSDNEVSTANILACASRIQQKNEKN